MIEGEYEFEIEICWSDGGYDKALLNIHIWKFQSISQIKLQNYGITHDLWLTALFFYGSKWTNYDPYSVSIENEGVLSKHMFEYLGIIMFKQLYGYLSVFVDENYILILENR